MIYRSSSMPPHGGVFASAANAVLELFKRTTHRVIFPVKLWRKPHAFLSVLLTCRVEANQYKSMDNGEVAMQKLAVRILRKTKPRTMAFTPQKAYWAYWWLMVVCDINRARKYTDSGFELIELTDKLRPVIQAHEARLGAH